MLTRVWSANTMRRTQFWAAIVLLVMLFVLVCYSSLYAQIVPPIDSEIQRRVRAIEAMHPEARLGIIETRLDNIEWVGKGILTIVAGQLILSAMDMRKRRY